jgi:hypothetical protein
MSIGTLPMMKDVKLEHASGPTVPAIYSCQSETLAGEVGMGDVPLF